MISTQSARRRRLFAAAAALSALVVALLASLAIATQPIPGPPQARGANPPCAHAAQLASELSRQELRNAVRCLINQERAADETPKLARDPSLERVAASHSKVMVETDCLEHRCQGEPSLETRIAKAGYFADARAWEYAENTGCARSAEAMVASWMASRVHRVYILDRDFRDLGVGVVQTPVDLLCEDDYATFAIIVAWRKLES